MINFIKEILSVPQQGMYVTNFRVGDVCHLTVPLGLKETFNVGVTHVSGEGNGNPVQYSCLENPMDREAWQATVHGVTKS